MRIGGGNRWYVRLGIVGVWLGVAMTQAGLAQVGRGGGGGGGSGGSGGSGGFVGGGGGGGGPLPPGAKVVTSSHRESSEWGGPSSSISLISNESVRRELGLTAAQQAQVLEWIDKVRGANQGMARGMTGGDGIRDRARRLEERLTEMNRSVAALEARVRETLNEVQRKEFEQACAKDRTLAGRSPATAGGTAGTTVHAARAASVDFGGNLPAGGFIQTNVSTGGGSYVGGGAPGSPIRVIRYPTVRRSLELTPEQDATLDRIVADFAALEAKFRQDVDRERSIPPSRRGVPPEARTASRVAAQATTELSSVLSPEQSERLRQISIQFEGAGALLRPDVVDALKLNATQQARLASIAQQTRKKSESYIVPPMPRFDPSSGLPPSPPPSSRPPRPPNFEAADRVRRQGDQGMLAVLTEAQRQAFERMKGRPFEGLDQLAGFGGGGGAEGGDFKATLP